MGNPENYKKLIQRYSDGTASSDELEMFFHLLKDGELDNYLVEDMKDKLASRSRSKMFFKTRIKLTKRQWSYAVMIAIVCSFTFLLLFSKDPSQQFVVKQEVSHNEALPASDKAVLILADGTEVNLENNFIGSFVEQGSKITIDGSGSLEYTDRKKSEESFLKYNQMRTPRGGKYRIMLVDGTLVWLNSSSELKYPVSFNKYNREVFLTGEAYFEVAQDNKRPFIIHTEQQHVEVLGTHFNIKAYSEDEKTETTLFEGSVSVNIRESNESAQKVRKPIILIPGQQAKSAKGAMKLKVINVNTEESMAWRNGNFLFKDTPLLEIMKQLSRWYNVDIDPLNIPDYSYYGFIPRTAPLSEVLEMLELTDDLKFKIHNKQISIIK